MKIEELSVQKKHPPAMHFHIFIQHFQIQILHVQSLTDIGSNNPTQSFSYGDVTIVQGLQKLDLCSVARMDLCCATINVTQCFSFCDLIRRTVPNLVVYYPHQGTVITYYITRIPTKRI